MYLFEAANHRHPEKDQVIEHYNMYAMHTRQWQADRFITQSKYSNVLLARCTPYSNFKCKTFPLQNTKIYWFECMEFGGGWVAGWLRRTVWTEFEYRSGKTTTMLMVTNRESNGTRIIMGGQTPIGRIHHSHSTPVECANDSSSTFRRNGRRACCKVFV